MNHTAYLTPQEIMFQSLSQSVKPFNLEAGEHRDIESQNYYINDYVHQTEDKIIDFFLFYAVF